MENRITTTEKINRRRIKRFCTLLLLFFILLIGPTIMQAQEPDVKNLKNNLSAIKEAQKKQAHEEFMGYVYMTLGFGLVIFVAWFSTVKAKQYKEKQDEQRRKFLEARHANHIKDGHHGHKNSHAKGHRR